LLVTAEFSTYFYMLDKTLAGKHNQGCLFAHGWAFNQALTNIPEDERLMGIVDHSARATARREDRAAVIPRSLHRLATVRRLQGVARKALARSMKIGVAEIRRQEAETNDLPLSVLYQWQKVLGVPVAELLVEPEDSLSQPLVERAQLVRLMKTALAVLETADGDATRGMAQELVDQLIEVMPELQGVTAWNSVGERRRRDELGVAAIRTMPDDVFIRRVA
jgi:transcriptional regulator with XRE-family HTH domain